MIPFLDWSFFTALLLYGVLPIIAIGYFDQRKQRALAMVGVFFGGALLDVLFSKLSSGGDDPILQGLRRSLLTAWPFALFLLGASVWVTRETRSLVSFFGPVFLLFIFVSPGSAVLSLPFVLPGAGSHSLAPWHALNNTTTVSAPVVFTLVAVYLWAICYAYARIPVRRLLPVAIVLTIAPILLVKLLPISGSLAVFGILGLSYVTFRALDVVFSISDGALKAVAPGQLFAFLFFFPTLMSGPIDRYRRFATDWVRVRSRAEFIADLDFAISRVFRGFLYRFILGMLLETEVCQRLGHQPGVLAGVGYMYAYTLYLFFDFAGYSAFAVGISRLLGVRTPENFDAPFAAQNIRDFWNRWHISLSAWLRDHVHLRFQLAAAKGKWFKGKHTAGTIATFLTFGIMGVWHGLTPAYLLYGLYHAVLVSGQDRFARWNRQSKFWPDTPRGILLARVVTFHAVAFGMLVFSGRLTQPTVPKFESRVEQATCKGVSGYVWDADRSRVHSVKLYVDFAAIGVANATDPRPDLAIRSYGDGNIGFHVEIPPATVGNRTVLMIDVRDAETEETIGEVQTVRCDGASGG